MWRSASCASSSVLHRYGSHLHLLPVAPRLPNAAMCSLRFSWIFSATSRAVPFRLPSNCRHSSKFYSDDNTFCAPSSENKIFHFFSQPKKSYKLAAIISDGNAYLPAHKSCELSMEMVQWICVLPENASQHHFPCTLPNGVMAPNTRRFHFLCSAPVVAAVASTACDCCFLCDATFCYWTKKLIMW